MRNRTCRLVLCAMFGISLLAFDCDKLYANVCLADIAALPPGTEKTHDGIRYMVVSRSHSEPGKATQIKCKVIIPASVTFSEGMRRLNLSQHAQLVKEQERTAVKFSTFVITMQGKHNKWQMHEVAAYSQGDNPTIALYPIRRSICGS